MELKCQFKQQFPTVTGQGKNGEWKKTEFLCEVPDPQYPKKIIFSIWGDKSSLIDKLQPGQQITVKFDAESREYNSRWYTELKAFQIETGSVVADQATRNEPAFSAPAASQPEQGGGDSLPF